MIVAYVTAGIGVLVLLLVLLVVHGRYRRFSRAAATLRSGLARGSGELRAARRRTTGDDITRSAVPGDSPDHRA